MKNKSIAAKKKEEEEEEEEDSAKPGKVPPLNLFSGNPVKPSKTQ